MKIGSIVVARKCPISPDYKHLVKWVPVQDEETPYMVRGIDRCPVVHLEIVYLEEGIIGYNEENGELGFPKSHLREILPPEDIAEQVEDMMCVPMKKEF